MFWEFNLHVMSYIDRLQFLKLITLEHRLLVLSLCMFHKIFNRFVYCDVLTQFRAPSRQLLSHKYKLFILSCKSNVRKNFFSLKLLRIWNSLPESIVSSNVMTAFMRRICEFDLSDYLRLNEF